MSTILLTISGYTFAALPTNLWFADIFKWFWLEKIFPANIYFLKVNGNTRKKVWKCKGVYSNKNIVNWTYFTPFFTVFLVTLNKWKLAGFKFTVIKEVHFWIAQVENGFFLQEYRFIKDYGPTFFQSKQNIFNFLKKSTVSLLLTWSISSLSVWRFY